MFSGALGLKFKSFQRRHLFNLGADFFGVLFFVIPIFFVEFVNHYGCINFNPRLLDTLNFVLFLTPGSEFIDQNFTICISTDLLFQPL